MIGRGNLAKKPEKEKQREEEQERLGRQTFKECGSLPCESGEEQVQIGEEALAEEQKVWESP